MASHDYYNSQGYGYDNRQAYDYNNPVDTSYHDIPTQRRDAPLPALPGEPNLKAAGDQTSPFNTPFDDHYTSYNPSRQSMDHYSQQTRSHDPFTDNNAIPLQSQSFNKSERALSPTMAESQPFPPYDRPQKQDTGRGWFRGKIPYAVYTLSLIQIIVMIVEYVKMGKEPSIYDILYETNRG
jgi:hypothetical protein